MTHFWLYNVLIKLPIIKHLPIQKQIRTKINRNKNRMREDRENEWQLVN